MKGSIADRYASNTVFTDSAKRICFTPNTQLMILMQLEPSAKSKVRVYANSITKLSRTYSSIVLHPNMSYPLLDACPTLLVVVIRVILPMIILMGTEQRSHPK